MKKKLGIIILALVLVLIPVFNVGCGNRDSQETLYTVTVVGGKLADGSTSGKFKDGTEITVTAVVPTGKGFKNWTEDQTILSSSAQYTFKVSYDITLTANFTDGNTVWVLEAEAMNLDDYAGVGFSGGGAGAGAIQGVNDAGISKIAKDSLNRVDAQGNNYNAGFFVGFFNGNGTTFKFTFESDKDADNCTLTLRLGSEHGDMMFNPDLLTIRVNGVDLDYEPFTVKGESNGYGAFADYTLSAKINLKKNTVTGNDDIKDSKGNVVIERPIRVQNTVELILRANTYWTDGNNPTGGPGIDCIKIESDSNISFVDYWLGGWPEDFEEDGGKVNILDRIGYVENEK